MAAGARRSRTALAHLLAAGGDLVGPPNPLTNLRPVWYAPRFTAAKIVNAAQKLHPYSLDEFESAIGGRSHSLPAMFGTVATTAHTARRQRNLDRLESLRSQFEAEDLAWRMQRRRLDQMSHVHWARSNAAFLAAKADAEERASLSSLSSTVPDPLVMEDFLKRWVDEKSQGHERYQQEWLRGIAAQIRPAIKAIYRDWRWNFELWRCKTWP